MATHRMSILGAGSKPDASGDVFFEPFSVKATAAVFDPMVLIFNDSGNEDDFHGSFVVPENYVGSANFYMKWVSTATTGEFRVEFLYRAIADTEDGDPATAQETVTSDETVDGTALDINTTTMALTDGNFAAGDVVQFILRRDGADVADDMGAAAIILAAMFQYDDA